MYINVEKEYVRCKQCNEVKEFCGLSDFSYGKLLVRLFRGTKYLYVDMMTDPVFKEIDSDALDIRLYGSARERVHTATGEEKCRCNGQDNGLVQYLSHRHLLEILL